MASGCSGVMARDARRSRTNRIQPLAETTAAATINRPRAKSSVPCRSMGTERVPETTWWACRRLTLSFAVAESASGSGERVLALLVELGLEVVDLLDEIAPLRPGRINH